MRDAPELAEHLSPYYEAFWHLDSCRQFAGMGGVPCRIPWTALDRYAMRHSYSGEEFEDLKVMMEEMDGAYIKYRVDKMKEEGDGNSD